MRNMKQVLKEKNMQLKQSMQSGPKRQLMIIMMIIVNKRQDVSNSMHWNHKKTQEHMRR